MNSSETDQNNKRTISERPKNDMPYSVILIPMGHSNSYLIVSCDLGVLVDAGCAGKIKNLENALKQNNLMFRDIVLIVITHTHHDHVGCLAEIKERSRAKVLVHVAEKEYLERGITPFPRGTIWFSKIISAIGNLLMASKAKYQPVIPNIIVKDEYNLGNYIQGAKIIPTPGHTAGSISLVIENKAAFVGDTLFNVIPGTVFPPFANNVPELLKSWEELISLGCRTFYPGHGRSISLQKMQDSYWKRGKKK